MYLLSNSSIVYTLVYTILLASKKVCVYEGGLLLATSNLLYIATIEKEMSQMSSMHAY